MQLRVPASWRVVSFAQDPTACPRLDVHAVYLGSPGADPICPAGLVGKTEAVMIEPMAQGGARPRAPQSAEHSSGARARAAGKQRVSRTITERLPRAGVQVSIYYRTGQALARTIRSSIRVTRSASGSVGTHQASTAPPAARSGARARTGSPGRVMRRAGRASRQRVFAGGGFDACAAPSAGTMTKWLASSYRAVGIYIGGINRACAQANLTPSWLTSIVSHGWHYFPIYPGLQSSCVLAAGDATITTSKAAAEGRAAAADAAAQAASLGIGRGTPLSYDMEAYGPACNSQVTTFLSAWDAELNARGYRSGVYESFTNIGALVSAAGSITEPDVIYYADWDGKATTTSSYMPANMWTNHQRIHQYRGGHLETYGGVTINIDSDQLDVNFGGTVAPAKHPGYRIATAINSNGTAEWFARSAAGALAHAWQQPVGSLTWSAVHTVGESPTTIVSNPSAVAQADGRLTVFARDAAGRIEHAWQQAGFPNDWEWGKPLARSPLQARAGTDPAAVLLPAHQVALYLTTAGGAVLTARQRRPNHNARWTEWRNLGGDCASTPVPVVSFSGGVDVFCVTAAGAAAATHWSGSSWSGWITLAGSPADLRGVPAVMVGGSGQAELFAATTSGGLDDAWLSGGNAVDGVWSWGRPLAGPGSSAGNGTAITGSPAAATWPRGNVIVYARLAGGRVGYLRHSGSAGSAPWSGWSLIGAAPGGKVIGSPAGWLNSSGAAGVAVLDGRLMLAVTSNSGNGWAGWTEVGGGF